MVKFWLQALLLFCYRICTGMQDPSPLEWEAAVNHRARLNEYDETKELPQVGREFEKEVLAGDNNADYIRLGKELVRTWYDAEWQNRSPSVPVPEYNVYCTWFSKTLGNWKGLFGTTRPDNLYIEITHDGAKGKTYFDVYRKMVNLSIPDKTLENGTYA